MKKQFCSVIVLVALAAMMIGILLSGCGKGAGSDKEKGERADTASFSLSLPQPPASITDQEKRLEFVARHFWDAMDWQDTLLLKSDRFMGEAMANYGVLLASINENKRASIVIGLISSVSTYPKALEKLGEYAYNYFYYPGAPQYDPELYLLFLNPLLAQNNIDASERLRLENRKAEILKNRVGREASDFSFIDTDGKQRIFSSLFPDAEIKILMLYDPECNVCDEAVKLMNQEGGFSSAVKEGRVGIVAVNAYGQKDGGKAVRKQGMPEDWIVGYSPDGEIENEEIYIIRSTPSIYLLDRSGKIVEKDISLTRLSQIVQ
ncbi:MAG: DUF5106 domain-containing protein [Muribaculaceae bacterium]|nr:DUF5106 domain-containing protein [Muribaculaceae bacterium]MDE6755156.1 DUF5106 domain-containing protein [Muribaculaceae bacterium]